MMFTHRIRRGLILAIPIALVLSACGSAKTGAGVGSAPVSSNAEVAKGAPVPPDDLVKKAKDEGKVTIYTAISTASVLTSITKSFNTLYPGISVRFVTLGEADLGGRFDTEAKAGATQADAVLTGYSSFFTDNLKNGRLLPIDSVIPGFSKLYPAHSLYENNQLPIEFRLLNGFAYDTNVVKGADIPTSFADFAKPYWKGHLIGFDVKGANVYNTWAYMILKNLGEDTLRKIWANVIPNKKFAKTTDAAASLAAGEGYADLFMSATAIQSVLNAGAPLKYVLPDLLSGSEFGVAVTKDGPDVNAGKLFAYWALSIDGQKALTTANQSIGPLEGTPAKYVAPPLVIPAADLATITSILT
jgi:iron(III) transport system substrate-binding protein